MTAAELTRWAKERLTNQGFRLNRVNNIPVRRRKGTIEKGWADLQGYTANGIYVAVEVKTELDKLSKEQIDRMADVSLCGGIAYICTVDKSNKPSLIAFDDYKK